MSVPHYHQQIDHLNKKINKETSELNCIIDQMELTEVYRIIHSIPVHHIFFSEAHEIFPKLDHILGH
jgi:hypothetical protein